ncbi:hypothetical protein [Mycoplasma sp. E35C]|uniref:hypothetical protein n=1 Tax=Mycoplasma sp. E35C TaxID=2801918 RepID=UPI001CA3E3F3|nr:hypothetical protein [Mycoplasma sp. E35C]QZX49285.1 hypothetical protein JJE79_00815 [Mycoplasma sp. E35C]
MNKNKLLIIDVDVRSIYDDGYDIDALTKVINDLKDRFEIIISSNSWYENILHFNNLVKLDVDDINILMANGACLRKKHDKKFYYESIFKKNDYDLINHLALIKQSGIVAKGLSNPDSYDNLAASYFLNYNTIKQARQRWKHQMNWNNDYDSFNQQIKKMVISQIYLFNISEWINCDDFSQTIKNHDRFEFIKLNHDDGLFINKDINKYNTIKKHFNDSFLIYLSLNDHINEQLLDHFDYNVFSSKMAESYHKKAQFIYQPNQLHLLLENLKSIV